MIKHFCDICGNEMTQRIRIHITAEEVFGEAYFKTIGENLMNIDYECCDTCYNKLVDIANCREVNGTERPESITKRSVSDDESKPLSLFDKLREFIRGNKED